MTGRAFAAIVLASCAVVGSHARAQSAAKPLAFDVASIKRNKSGNPVGRLQVQTGGRLLINNVSPNTIIATAYGTADAALWDSQIVGGPDWLKTDRFDVEVRPPSGLGVVALRAPETREMLRSLLAERFRLSAHREMQSQSVYALVLARNDGGLGKQFRRVDVDCLALLAAQRAATASGSKVTAPLCSLTGPMGSWVGHGYSVGQLADLIARTVHGLVVDHTGLEGMFDFELSWAPDEPVLSDAAAPVLDSNKPSIFTALSDQLGLKLEKRNEPVEVVVIDHIERPTED